MMAQEFWQKEPKRPFKDWRTYMIGLPVLSSAWGGCWFMFLAFSFTELGAIPDAWRTWIVVMAAFGTAFGSAFGSVGSSIEIYTKAFEKRAERLDWISLALSIAATMGGFILGFAALLAGAEWAVFVRLWGPIALSILVAGDAASDVIQLGGLFASYNMRYKAWEDEKRVWIEAQREEQEAQPENWETGRIEDYRRIRARHNGDGLDKDQLEEEFAAEHKLMPHPNTVRRWFEGEGR